MARVVLIDQDGATREMDIDGPLEVRVPVRRPLRWTLEPDDAVAAIAHDVVTFRDSGLRDDLESPILTPDGRTHMVPLGFYRRPIFRRGQTLEARVWVSDSELAHMRMKRDDMLREMAYGHFREMVEPTTRLLFVGIAPRARNESTWAQEFSVFAEERLPLTMTEAFA